MKNEIIISNRYIVKRKIGEGGMAKVYLAYDKKTEQNVAIKILKNENIDERKIRSFRREAETLSILNDENIVSIIDVGEENDVYYIVNEFIEGMTLKEYISTCSPLEVEEVINITIQILKGLSHAHEKGVVHKDIKSQNILLNQNREAKITDLGIADIIDGEFTRTQSLMGTPQYVAPEILNRENLTIQSDIYSVGILLYEMLVGHAPFTGEKPAIIMIKQMNHPLPSIIEKRSDVPQTLENIAIKASAKKLENRYQTVNEMLEDLIQVQNGKTKAPKLILENDLSVSDDKKLEQTIVMPTEQINIETIKKKSNKKKKIIISSIIIALAIISFFAWQAMKPKDLIMPDLIGKDIETVKISEYLARENISIIYKNSDEYKENQIIATNPKAGSKVTDGQEIIFTVSQGPKTIELEDFTGKNADTAKITLEKLGYDVEVKQVNSLQEKGTIVNQEPPAGQLISYDDKIILYSSTQTIELTVPNFIGLPLSEVSTWATNNQIKLETTDVCAEGFKENQVTSQSPNYKETIKNGNILKVNVVGNNCDININVPKPEEESTSGDTQIPTTPEGNNDSQTDNPDNTDEDNASNPTNNNEDKNSSPVENSGNN